jgi:hypothetical protein
MGNFTTKDTKDNTKEHEGLKKMIMDCAPQVKHKKIDTNALILQRKFVH